MTKVVFTHPAGQIYQFKTVVTQVNAGATTVGIRLTPAAGTWCKLLGIIAGPDDYAADRRLIALVDDEDGANPFAFWDNSTVDNEQLRGPTQLVNDVNGLAIVDAQGVPLDFIYTDLTPIFSEGIALAQNETFTPTFYLLVFGDKPPTHAIVGAAATEVIAFDGFQ